MNCPKCKSGRGYIKGSVLDRQNVTYRRRVCNMCGHEFYSVETEVSSPDDYHRAWNMRRALNNSYKEK
jgi:transcriptional regulator NrdR family protein